MTFRKSICASILVGGACTAMSLAANAAIYVGSFDPLWGVSVNGPVSGTGYLQQHRLRGHSDLLCA